MSDRVVRTLAFYDKGKDPLVGEYQLVGIDLPALQALFRVEPEDPMYDVWPVGPTEMTVLRNHVAGEIDQERYDYYLECYAKEAEGESGSDTDRTSNLPCSQSLR
jgi:hypothetical protein